MSAAIDALRSSHERFRSLVSGLSDDQVRGQSYHDWTIAEVASHLGSQSEIFLGFVEAGVKGTEPPGFETFQPVWDRWNSKPPADQVADSLTAQERLMSAVESERDNGSGTFTVALFGRDQDLDGFAVFRLSEHAVHTWDVAVALDPSATVAADAVEQLLSLLPNLARGTKPVSGAAPVVVATTDGHGAYRITLDPDVTIGPVADAPADVQMPSEALLRLVYGRLDPAHTPEGVDDPAGRLDDLRKAFPGF